MISYRQVDGLRKKIAMEAPREALDFRPAAATIKPNPVLKFILGRFSLPSLIITLGVLAAAAIQISAFEAHVLDVTATIDRHPASCDVRPPNFWKDNDGCENGSGENIWASQLNVLSNDFSGVFGAINGTEICTIFSPSGTCPAGNGIDNRRCLARFHLLNNELNLASGHLDPDAILAGSDTGSTAFDHLGLNSNSTIAEALMAVEAIVIQPEATLGDLQDAVIVGKHIWRFYLEFNPFTPQCVFSGDNWGTAKDDLNLEVTTEAVNEGEETAVPEVKDSIEIELEVVEPEALTDDLIISDQVGAGEELSAPPVEETEVPVVNEEIVPETIVTEPELVPEPLPPEPEPPAPEAEVVSEPPVQVPSETPSA